jgi:hypothetical protein
MFYLTIKVPTSQDGSPLFGAKPWEMSPDQITRRWRELKRLKTQALAATFTKADTLTQAQIHQSTFRELFQKSE